MAEEVYNAVDFTASWVIPSFTNLASGSPLNMTDGLVRDGGLTYEIVGEGSFRARKHNDGIVSLVQTESLVYRLTWTYLTNSPTLLDLQTLFSLHKLTGAVIAPLWIRDQNDNGVMLASSAALVEQPTRSPNSITRSWTMIASGVLLNF